MQRKRFFVFSVIALVFLCGVLTVAPQTKAQTTSGIVTIAFDDGMSSQYANAFPLMQEHGFAGTYYIITNDIGTDGYMNMSDLHALQNAGNEIGSHTVNHPDMTTLTDSQINYECSTSQQLLQSNGFSATDFAYPYGYSNSHVDSIVLQYYRSARYSYAPDSSWLMPITPSPIQMSIPYGVQGETGDSSALANDESYVQLAYSTNSWVIIFFHNIVTTPLTDPWEIGQSDFAAFLNYVGNSSVRVLTVNQALNLWSSPEKVTILPSYESSNLYPYGSIALDVGQDQVFTASASGGTGPYTYQWYLNNDQIGTGASLDLSPASAGSYSLYATATDSTGNTVTSNTESITVSPQLMAPTIAASPKTIDLTQSSTLTSSSISTGESPYSYQWFWQAPGGSFSAINGATYSSFLFATSAYTTPGTWHFELQVSDSSGVQVTSNSVSIRVNDLPTVSLSPSALKLDIGQSVTFYATASGGSGSYLNYHWYVDYILQSGQTDSSFTYWPNSSGQHQISVVVTDSQGVTSSEATTSLSVSRSPFVTISPAGSLNLDDGQIQVFTATSSGGTGPLSYQWYLDNTEVGSNSATYKYAATEGMHTVSCVVTDSASSPQSSPTSNIVSLQVNPNPSVTLLPSSGTIDLGQKCNITASASGGSKNYTSYQWYINGVAVEGQILQTFSYQPNSTGTFSVTVAVTDSCGVTSTKSPAASIKVNPALVAPTIIGSDAHIVQGDSANFTSNVVTSGTSPYTYQWFESAPNKGYVAANSKSPNLDFVSSSATQTGTWKFLLQVTDSTGAAVNTTSISLSVNPKPKPTPTPTPTPQPTQTTNQTQTGSQTQTPSPTPNQTSSLIDSTFPARTNSGSTVNLSMSGNVTSSQIFDATINSNNSNHTLTISFSIEASEGNYGFSNITIPKSLVSAQAKPTVYINDQCVQNQGYSTDNQNYYVWFTTGSNSSDVSIAFEANADSISSNPNGQSIMQTWPWYAALIAGVVAISLTAVWMFAKIRKKEIPATTIS